MRQQSAEFTSVTVCSVLLDDDDDDLTPAAVMRAIQNKGLANAKRPCDCSVVWLMNI